MKQTMLAVVKEKAAPGVVIKKIPVPKPQKEEVLIKVLYSSICGTEAMSVQEPLGNAVHVVTKANVRGKKVLVVGLGPTGLCAGAVAKAYGAGEVIGINRGEYRRKLANKMGFDRTVSFLSPKEFNSYDTVLEMSGNPEGIQTALQAVRIAGTIVMFGIPKEKVSIDLGKYVINKEIEIESVFGRRIWETWFQTTALLVSKKLFQKKLI